MFLYLQKKKRWLPHLRQLFLLLLLITSNAFAATFTVDDIQYKTLGVDEVSVYKYVGFSENVVIPSSVQNAGQTYRVTTIGSNAFSGCSSLTYLTIPDGVWYIGEYAFSHCTGLTLLVLPESVTHIDDFCFYGCSLKPLKILSKGSLTLYSNTFVGMKETSEIACLSGHYNQISYYAGNIHVFQIDVPEIILSNTIPHYCGISFNCSIGEDNPYFEGKPDDLAYFAHIKGDYFNVIPVSTKTSNLLKGLTPDKEYIMIVGYYGEGSEEVVCEEFSFRTAKPNIRAEYEATQTTLTVKSIEVDSDDTCPPFKFYAAGKEYTGGILNLTGLRPNYRYSISAKYNGIEISDKIGTKDIDVSGVGSGVYPNAIECDGDYDLGDARLGGVEWVLNGETVSTSERLVLTGLTPERQYPVVFRVNVACDNGSVYSKTWSQTFATPALKLEMLPPKSVGNGKTIVSAKTNISESEANVGFEWKKVDAPETLPYSRGYAAVYDGSLEGLIQNLQANYYNVRAFYKDASDNYYYTDIVSFDPTDFTFFEPTVHTYPAEAGEDYATLCGYALGGTDDVEEQGFQYWIVSSENQIPQYGSSRAPERDVMTVTAEGQRMSVVISDLKPGTTYAFRAFVKTKSSVKYGEEMTFETLGTGDVEDIVSEDEEVTVVGYYDLSGRRYAVPQRGFNIVLYSNGESRKMICK